MKNESSVLKQFLAGLVMLVAGLYWFFSKITVSAGFFSWGFGGFRAGGLVVVPLIAGVIWIFMNPGSIGAKFLTGAGLLLIVASIIMGTYFSFQHTSLYEYLIMLVLIFGGAALDLKVLLAKPDRKKPGEDSLERQKKQTEEFSDADAELEQLKKTMKKNG